MGKIKRLLYKGNIAFSWAHIILLVWEIICEESNGLNPYKAAWEKAFAGSGYFAAMSQGKSKKSVRKLEFKAGMLYEKIRQLKRRGLIERAKEATERLYHLTSKGEFEVLKLKLLMSKCNQEAQKWDNHWYLVLFDIPEYQRRYRNLIRHWLKRSGFIEWQKSVWVAPYDLRHDLGNLVNYLKLNRFVEFVQLNHLPNEDKFKKKFRLVGS